MSIAKRERERRLRGEILRLLRECHDGQEGAYDDVVLAGVLDRLRFAVSVNMVRALLEDLKERGLLKYSREQDRITGTISIRAIKILPRGRDVLDGTIEDGAVEIIG